MFLFGVGYAGQRIATAVAKACGGDEWAQAECRKAAARLTIVADPIGTGLGMIHEQAKVASRYGSETGRQIDTVLDYASTADRVVSGIGDGFEPKTQ